MILLLLTFMFLFGGNDTLFAESLEASKNTDKEILLVFTGSDWCNKCLRLEKEIIGKEEIKDRIEERFIIHIADFPRKNTLSPMKTEDNIQLAEKYNPEGSFPKILILNADSNDSKEIRFVPGKEDQFITQLQINI